jgi:hypothetical protein
MLPKGRAIRWSVERFERASALIDAHVAVRNAWAVNA